MLLSAPRFTCLCPEEPHWLQAGPLSRFDAESRCGLPTLQRVFFHHRHGWKWKCCGWYHLWGHKGSFVIPAASRVCAALLGEGRSHLQEAARMLHPASPTLGCSSVLYRDKSCVGQPIHLRLGNWSLQAELGWKRQHRSSPELCGERRVSGFS